MLWGQDELTNSCFYHVHETLFLKIIPPGSVLLQVDVAFSWFVPSRDQCSHECSVVGLLRTTLLLPLSVPT